MEYAWQAGCSLAILTAKYKCTRYLSYCGASALARCVVVSEIPLQPTGVGGKWRVARHGIPNVGGGDWPRRTASWGRAEMANVSDQFNVVAWQSGVATGSGQHQQCRTDNLVIIQPATVLLGCPCLLQGGLGFAACVVRYHLAWT